LQQEQVFNPKLIMRKFMKLFKNAFLGLLFSNMLFAQLISIQGIARDNSGASLADKDYNITFRLFAAATGGAAVWTESQTLAVKNGVFSTNLGSENPMSSLNFNDTYYLSLEIGSNGQLTPRSTLTMSPYAIMSQLNGSKNVIPASGKVGFGTTSPDQQLHVKGHTKIENDLMLLSDDNKNGFIIHTRASHNYDKLYISPQKANGAGWDWGNSIVLKRDGNVGINTESPASALDITGITTMRYNGTALDVVGTDHTNIKFYARGKNNVYSGILGWTDPNHVTMHLRNTLGNIILNVKDGGKVYTTDTFEAPNIMYRIESKSSTNFNSKTVEIKGLSLDLHQKYKVFYTIKHPNGAGDAHFYVQFNNNTSANVHKGESDCKFWGAGSGHAPNNVGNLGIALGRQGWSQGGWFSGSFIVQRWPDGNGASVTGQGGTSSNPNPNSCTNVGGFNNGTNITSLKLGSTTANWARGKVEVYAIP
jgi:hypothetical protein